MDDTRDFGRAMDEATLKINTDKITRLRKENEEPREAHTYELEARFAMQKERDEARSQAVVLHGVLTDALPHLSFEIEQRKFGGNSEDWAELEVVELAAIKALSDTAATAEAHDKRVRAAALEEAAKEADKAQAIWGDAGAKGPYSIEAGICRTIAADIRNLAEEAREG